jgi:murein DD-endopeptidase MepM/ murein hydrolase activator NlpD
MRVPVNDYRMTSPYGMRKDPSGKTDEEKLHDGIDFVSKKWDNRVYSICSGKIIYDFDEYDEAQRWTSRKHSAGNMLIQSITWNDKKFYVRYLHLVGNFVKMDDVIPEGIIIGEYGDVGYSFGAHLHFDLYDNMWKKLNPEPLFAGLIEKTREDPHGKSNY